MKRSAAGSVLALILLASVAQAQRRSNTWDQLITSAPVGRKMVVTRVDQTQVSGTLLDINAHTITLQAPVGGIAIDAPDVLRVQKPGARHTFVKLIPLEALAGGLVMLGIDNQSSNPEHASAFIAGALLGGAAGGIVALATPAGHVLYEKSIARSAAGYRTPARSSPE